MRKTALALLALLSAVPAFGQGGIANFPQTVPPQTVVGRLGITPGPTQAIPISQLAAVFGASRSVTVNAKCDGATDDTAAINADLAQGGYWTLPPGKTCNVTQLNITQNNTRLSGAGMNSSIIQGTSANVPTINVSQLVNVYLSGFQVTKSVVATSGGTGIKYNGECQYCVIDGVFAQKNWIGFALQSAGVSYFRHSMSQYNLNDGVVFNNSAVSGALQWDLDDVFSGQNAGRGFFVTPGVAGPIGIALGSWHNVRTFGNTGVGAGFVGTPAMPINGIRITKGFLGADGNHEIFLDTYGGLHTIGSTYLELAGTGLTGPTFSTAASNTGDGVRITANNIDVGISALYANGNHDSGINTSATVSTNVSGVRISNHGLNGILAANCALLQVTGTNFVSNGTNINCTTNSGSQLVTTSTPSSLNTFASATAGCATWLNTPSSANLLGCVTDETGSGLAVFNNTPTLTAPIVAAGSKLDFTNATEINRQGSDGHMQFKSQNSVFEFVGSATFSNAAQTRTNLGLRQPLTANTTFNVATTGTDSNNCVSATPCLTIQRAYDNLANFYDLQGFTATIQVANGTYTAGLLTAKCVLGQNGTAGVQILGSATPSNVLISVTNTDAFGLGETAFGAGTQGCTQITIGGMKLVTTTGGNAVNVSGGGVGVTVGTPGFPIEFGAAAQDHMISNHSAWIIAGTNNLVSGSALIHVAALSNGVTALHGTTETFSNAPVFTYYAYADINASVYVDAMTFAGTVGAVTGTRYLAQNGGVIYALSASASYLPGNSTGVTQSKGNYVASAVSQWSLTADVTGTLPVANGGTNDTGTAWASYSGSVGAFTCAGGTITASVGSATFKNIGKTYWMHLDISETSNAACTGSILVANAFPATPKSTVTCSGTNKNTSVALLGTAPTPGVNSMTITTAAAAVPITGNGQFLSIDCFFEST